MSENTIKAPTPEKKGKVGSATADEQLKFLLSCIRYSVNGKIDFAEVAKDCSIISKGAAQYLITPQHTTNTILLTSAKRYERLMKAHNIEKKDAVSPRDASVASAKVKKGEVKPGAGTAAAANKKRKMLEADMSANHDEDDDEEPPVARKKKAVKKEKKEVMSEPAAAAVKVEIPQLDGASDICSIVKEEDPATLAIKNEPGVVVVKAEPVHEAFPNCRAEDTKMFDHFLQSGDFDQSIFIAD
ncbi:MAG: hypothetical protein LQ338_006240 [Usnochroma carphineum]|nr:MAG: hypothetical protein LQ338_006240 [Usnochroma carphineum]